MMEGLLSLLLVGGLFWLMMRYGCGAHMMHGGHGPSHGHEHADAGSGDSKDPVCGMVVDRHTGYGKMHEGRLYRFCSKACLDRFDAEPSRFVAPEHEEKAP